MKMIFCLTLFLYPYLNYSQAPALPAVSGKVVTADKLPLAGASIVLILGHRQTVAGSDGAFTIRALRLPDTLLISHTGYAVKRVAIKDSTITSLLIVLEQLPNKLDEVVVSTGYQELPKERSAGSFTKLDNALVNRRISTSVIDRLEGITPGLVFNRNTSTAAGGKPDLSIRGQSTIFANAQPLIVVDNFPYDGDLTNINGADVESITVLKDAAAASIWGARSGNGVIVITTKKGKRNQPLSIDLSTSLNFGERPDLFYSRAFIPSSPFIDLEQQLFSRGFYDADLSSTARPVVSPVVELLGRRRSGLITQQELDRQLNLLRQVDNRNDISNYLYQPSLNQQYALNLSGGGNNMSYAISLGSDNNRLNVTGNDYRRQTFTSNLNVNPTNNLELSFGIAYTHSLSHNNGLTNISAGGTAGKLMVPYASLIDSIGGSAALVHDYRKEYLDTAGVGQLLDWFYRPLDEQRNADQQTGVNDTRLNLGVKYNFPLGLQAELRYQYETAETSQRSYYSPETYADRHLINSFTSISGTTITRPVPIGGLLDKSANSLLSQRLRAQLNYKLIHVDHQVNALIGAEISQVTTERSAHRWYGYDEDIASSVAVDYVNTFKQYVSGSSARIPNSDALGATDNRFISYYVNAGYTYLNRFTLTASARVDKSNFFGVSTNHKQVPLWSAGTVWNLDREKFYHVSWMPQLKLRASYGYNANLISNTTAYTTATYSSNSPYYSQLPYATIISPANPSLRWEKIRMINLGIDFGLKDGKLSGSLEYYHKNGIDLSGESPLSPSSGFTNYTGNYAQTVGNGFDISLQNRVPLGRGFQFTNHWLLSGVWEKVTGYDVSTTATNYILNSYGNAGTVYPLAGKPLYSLYAYLWAGLDPATGDPQGYLNGKVSKDYANIIAKTTVDSMQFCGRTRPTITASWRMELNWRQWSISANFIAKLDYVFRRSSLSYNGLFNSWSANMDYLDRWQKPGDEAQTQIPSLQYPPVNTMREQFYATSDVLVEKADHIRLQDIRLSWQWSRALHPKLPFRSMDCFVYANNLGIIWRANDKGLDPDLFIGSMPLPTTIALGINIHF
jgi:TonB-linked SusC/RagA family outer membrane protein